MSAILLAAASSSCSFDGILSGKPVVWLQKASIRARFAGGAGVTLSDCAAGLTGSVAGSLRSAGSMQSVSWEWERAGMILVLIGIGDMEWLPQPLIYCIRCCLACARTTFSIMVWSGLLELLG